MNIGIFGKVFQRQDLIGVFDAALSHGIRHLQFNMSSVGLPTLPAEIPDSV